MVLSLAPIIKESVTKPNVSLAEAGMAEAQERFRQGHSTAGTAEILYWGHRREVQPLATPSHCTLLL